MKREEVSDWVKEAYLKVAHGNMKKMELSSGSVCVKAYSVGKNRTRIDIIEDGEGLE